MISPKQLLAAHNLRPQKKLGQNFLADPAAAEMIVRRSGLSPEDVVLEIGAGLGALTIPLARTVQRVYALDKDPRILNLLHNQIVAGNLSNVVITPGDILKFDLQALVREVGRKIVVIGNLPYNISSQILVRLVHNRDAVRHAILMFQKELAQRLTAAPGNKDYGRLTVMLRYSAEIHKVADVQAQVFYPRPKVNSEVLEFRFKPPALPSPDAELFFFKVIKAAFGNRRKTLKNALVASEFQMASATARQVLEQAGIDPMRRAETLGVHEFMALSAEVRALGPEDPGGTTGAPHGG